MNNTQANNKLAQIQQSALKLNATWAFLLTQAIVVPFFMLNKMSLANVFFIQFVHAIVVLLSDLPSSFVADRLGSRWVLIIACILRGTGGICFVLSHQFNEFLMTYIIIGLGNGFFSGVNISALFEVGSNHGLNYYDLFNKNYQNTRTMTILSLLSGSLIASISVYAVAVINACLAWLPLLYAMRIPINDRNITHRKSYLFVGNLSKQDFRLTIIILSASFYSFVPNFNLYVSQIFFHTMHYPIFYYGIAISFCQLFIIMISHFVKLNKNRLIVYILIITVLPCLSYMFYYKLTLFSFMFANICIEYGRYLNSICLLSYLNENCNDYMRSVINSIVNIVSTFFLLIFGSLTGYLFDHYSYQSTTLVCLGLFLSTGAIFIFYYYTYKWRPYETHRYPY